MTKPRTPNVPDIKPNHPSIIPPVRTLKQQQQLFVLNQPIVELKIDRVNQGAKLTGFLRKIDSQKIDFGS